MRRLIVLLAFVAVCTPALAGAARAAARSARDEANLVATRFLVAAALGDRRAACELYPRFASCRRGERFVGPSHFHVLAITVGRDRTVVRVSVGPNRGAIVLERADDSFVIVTAPNVLRTIGAPREATADLVVTRFLVAAALGDRGTACALYPSYFPCSHGGPVVGSANFEVVSTSLADPARPAVFASVDGLRGYFVLERRHGSLRIVSAELD